MLPLHHIGCWCFVMSNPRARIERARNQFAVGSPDPEVEGKEWIPGRELNPGHLRDRQVYLPLYYLGWTLSESNARLLDATEGSFH